MKLRKLIVIMLAILVCLTAFGGCAIGEGTAVYKDSTGKRRVVHATPSSRMDYYTQNTDNYAKNMFEVDLDWAIRSASHIVDAEFLGYHYGSYTGRGDLVFRIKNIYLGSVDNPDEVIFVPMQQTTYYLESLQEEPYETGKTYMLFLYYLPSVRSYEYDTYREVVLSYFPEEGEDWEKIHSDTSKRLASGPIDIDTILSESECVFVVEPKSTVGTSNDTAVTTYRCQVKMVLTGTPNNNGSILIPFANNTVEIGGKYIVMLNSTEETSEIYELSDADGVIEYMKAWQYGLDMMFKQQAVLYVPPKDAD